MRNIPVFLLCLVMPVCALFAQPVKKIVTAVTVAEPIRIDGVLDEPAWATAPAATDFIQRQPFNGKPASFNTTVRFLFDNSGLYVGAVMNDPHPDSIPTQMGLRDASGLNADNFILVLSPFNDGLNAFCFLVYASDVQADFKLAVDSDDDFSWDAVWMSKARKNTGGWVVEMKIPYSALRFPKKPVQEWGLNLQRQIRRYREVVTWNLVDSKVSGYVNQSGVLEGIRDIRPPLRLSLMPYLSAYLQNSAPDKVYTGSYNYGADLKLGINQSFTLDMTLIPDFGQVRSDDKVYNFSPFEIQYDERRQFFTEGTELFSKGGIFYTRRIGATPKGYDKPGASCDSNERVTDNPVQTDLINATKISGRTRKGLGIGIFNAMSANTWGTVTDTLAGTRRRILTQGFTNYNMIVLDQNLKNNSYIDFLNTHYYMPTEGYTANVTGTSFKFANKKFTHAVNGDAFVSQKYYSHRSPEFGYHYSLSFGKIAGKFRYNYSQLLQTDTYDPNDMGFNPRNNRFNNTLSFQYNQYDPFWKVLNWYNYGQVSYSTLYNGLKFSSLEFYLESNTTVTKGHVSLGANTNFSPVASHDHYEPRTDGWWYLSPAYGNFTGWISTDYRRTFAVDVALSGFLATKTRSSAYALNLSPRYRISDRIFLIYELYGEKILNDIGYVATENGESGDPLIIFGRRDRLTITQVLSLNYMITSRMGIDARARHYWVSAPYLSYSALQRDGTLRQEAWAGDGDVNYNLFNIDLSYTWNFAPGSQLSLMWKNVIDTFSNDIEPDFFRNLDHTLSRPSSNSFSIRVLYYLDAMYFKKK